VSLKYIPDLKFVFDDSAAHAAHIQQLLDEANLPPKDETGDD
jgi:ribosome-binding factor A